jgi:hypothetical protein
LKCDKCGSERVLSISAKCSDQFSANYCGYDYTGYVLEGIGIDDGEDYINFDFCLECGQLQGTWPKKDPELK